MINLNVRDVRCFLPAKDFLKSKEFYVALGWTVKWADANLALMEQAGHRFYLQNYSSQEWADNAMLHLSIDDANAIYLQIKALLDKGEFPNARVAAPKQEPYGALVTYVWDPTGVLLHLAQWN